MPILENPRHEAFARELAKGNTADEAYQLAGFSANRGNATRLKAKESILARLEELQGKAANRAIVTIESLIAEAEEARAAAMEKGQLSAAVSAITAKAKLAGLWLEKRET